MPERYKERVVGGGCCLYINDASERVPDPSSSPVAVPSGRIEWQGKRRLRAQALASEVHVHVLENTSMCGSSGGQYYSEKLLSQVASGVCLFIVCIHQNRLYRLCSL